MTLEEQIASVGKLFGLSGRPVGVEVLKNGNINATCLATYSDGARYVMQKINTHVFTKPEQIMENIDLVTTHIRERYPDEMVLHFYRAADGRNYLYDTDGAFWRCMDYVDSVTFNTCDDLQVVENTGYAFGHFQMQLSDLNGADLHETIPNFHNTRARMDKLWEDAEKDPVGRVKEVRDVLDFLKEVEDKACELSVRQNSGCLPVRVTHNDTKSNNVLFDKTTKKPLVVIDLDTVMPGLAMFDFGDAIRFIANTAAEDEPDLSLVHFDIRRFNAFTKGFVGQVSGALTREEIEALPLGAFSMTVELVTRFVDDYICGDTYFKINYPEHNLVRTRNQMKLAQDMLAHWDEMEASVREIAG